MRPGRPHVLHVGFHASEAPAVDFDADNVTAVMPRASAARLPADVASRFARIATLDLSASADLDSYDRAIVPMRDLAAELIAEFGPPAGIVGLYEHTTLPAARLREHFGVPGTMVRTALLCRDKVPMKQALASAGIRVPRFLAVSPRTGRAELEHFAGQLPGKMVLKPRSQGASIGVRLLNDAGSLLALAAEGGIEEGYEVEEFVDGSIYHVDGIVRDGVLRWSCVSRYLETCFDFQYGDRPLASVTTDDFGLAARMRELAAVALRALGLADSAFHLELFHTPGDELVFLEVGNRFGGAAVPWHQRAIYGVDLAREAVLACTGRPSELPVPLTMLDCPGTGASGWLYMPSTGREPGRVVQVTSLEELPGSIVGADIPAVGDVLNPAGDIWPTSGKFLVSGDSAAAVEQAMDRIISTYTVVTKAGE